MFTDGGYSMLLLSTVKRFPHIGKVLFTTLLFQPFMLVRYTHGFNLRAIGAFVLALIPNLPGFAAKVNDKARVPISATYI